MSVFKCKMCGGTLELTGNATVTTCEYCGTQQTLPRLDDDRRANLYDRANHFRRNNDYDKAMGIYEQILSEDTTDAEAYWSLVLCRYGIEYVADPASGKRIPTVNRTQFTAVYDDDNYKSALRYADSQQKALYEAEANAINQIQKGILAISQQEAAFDVFICYKETDAQGRRTQDSVLANELYHQLTQEGFQVFFSRITLEDKLGSAYEPYIFAALHSAKVMVVLGTDPSYFKAVWVRNEWSRYLALIKQGQKKMLIPAYKGMDPYDLPEEFSHLQALDMSRLGFMQDLIRGIKKVLQADEAKPTVIQQTLVAGSASIEPLLRRAFMFLEDSDWTSANEYCEKVLDIDPENPRAYLGKLMADLRVKKQEDLALVPAVLETNSHYRKAVRFADEALSSTLVALAQTNRKNLEDAQKDDTLAAAKVLMAKGTADACRDAITMLKSIPGWKDAASTLEACQKQLDQLLVQNQQDTRQKKKLTAILLSVGAVVLALIVVLVIVISTALPGVKYKKAVQLAEAGNYLEAIAAFETLGGYEDSAEQITDCYYHHAQKLMEAGNYNEALTILHSLDGYQESAELIAECQYMDAMSLLDAGRYEDAKAAFQTLSDYKDSADLVTECNYRYATELVNAGEHAQALAILMTIGNYKDSASMISQCQYPGAVAMMEEGRYEQALEVLESLDGYADSDALADQCRYQVALSCMEAGNYDTALEHLLSLGNYKDSTSLVQECNYQRAMKLIEAYDFAGAIEILTGLGNYKDSAEQIKELDTIQKQIGYKDKMFRSGTWWPLSDKSWHMHTQVLDPQTIQISIVYSSDGWANTIWEMTGTWDPATGRLNYSNAVNYTEGQYEYWYMDGTGYFYYLYGMFHWKGDHSGEEKSFEYEGTYDYDACPFVDLS